MNEYFIPSISMHTYIHAHNATTEHFLSYLFLSLSYIRLILLFPSSLLSSSRFSSFFFLLLSFPSLLLEPFILPPGPSSKLSSLSSCHKLSSRAPPRFLFLPFRPYSSCFGQTDVSPEVQKSSCKSSCMHVHVERNTLYDDVLMPRERTHIKKKKQHDA